MNQHNDQYMKSRRQARGFALQGLYQNDILNDWSPETVLQFFSHYQQSIVEEDSSAEDSQPEADSQHLEFAKSLVLGVGANREAIDQALTASSTHWSIERMARVDRNILRIAAYEMLFNPETPVNVIIDEAIEISKSFASDDSAHFINGVLDNVAKRIRGELKKAV